MYYNLRFLVGHSIALSRFSLFFFLFLSNQTTGMELVHRHLARQSLKERQTSKPLQVRYTHNTPHNNVKRREEAAYLVRMVVFGSGRSEHAQQKVTSELQVEFGSEEVCLRLSVLSHLKILSALFIVVEKLIQLGFCQFSALSHFRVLGYELLFHFFNLGALLW